MGVEWVSNDEWKKANTIRINVRLTKNSGLVEALKTASEKAEISESMYIRNALIEKLRRDGYLQD